MDFLNQATGQLRDLALSMTPAARVTALLLLGVIGVSLGYLVQHQTSSPDDYLFNGEYLPGSVVDRAEAAIAQANLEGYERVGNRIKVPRARKSEFLGAVADGGALPPNFHKIVNDALDMSPFASGDTRREKLKAAREQQLGMLVGDMDGIEQAHVMFDVREAQGLARRGQATATVSVRPEAGRMLDARHINMIRKAVAGGIAELQPENVVVMNSGDGSSFGSSGGITDASFENEYYQTKLAFEAKMQGKIEHLLLDVPGARVQVIADLESSIERTTQITSPEGEPKAYSESKQEETDTIAEVENGGRPGLTAQGPLRNGNQESTVTVKNEHKSEVNQTESLVGEKREFTREAALMPENVRAVIAVPMNYLVSVWREREAKKGNDPNQPLPNDIDEQLKIPMSDVTEAIKNTVTPLLPRQLAKNARTGVEVTFFESISPEEIEEPSTAMQALGWASKNFNTMTMAGIALISLIMLRSMVKSIPDAKPAVAIRTPTLALDTVEGAAQPGTGGNEGEDGQSQRPRLKLKKGESLKDDLIDIVREDPDAAAAILRSWIGNAG